MRILFVFLFLTSILIFAAFPEIINQSQTYFPDPQEDTAQRNNLAFEKKTERDTLQLLAFEFAQTAENFIQDGYNLRLKGDQNSECCRCFTYIFDHYGDPDSLYELKVKINEQGKAVWDDNI